jgi:hypothetical protein
MSDESVVKIVSEPNASFGGMSKGLEAQSVVIVPDIHFGLAPSYLADIDYPSYILATFQSLLDAHPKALFILTGDVWHDAGTKSKCNLDETELMLDLIRKGQALIVRGNGKHCYDVYKGGETIESKYGEDCALYHRAGLKIALLGYQKAQDELDRKLTELLVLTPDYLVTHNFLQPVGKDPWIDVNRLPADLFVVAGHNHTFSKLPNRHGFCLGSMVDTDFGSACEHRFYIKDRQPMEIEHLRFRTFHYDGHPIELPGDSINRVIVAPGVLLNRNKITGPVDKIELATKESPAQVEQGSESTTESGLVDQWRCFADSSGERQDVIKLGEEVLNAD